ncbi:hypothetical protein EV360DRAFT_82285 [Lentinula raphanica]|nr:hypothetical protein EV360DRAFT_82285 [Lentinula raphanica]
MIFLDSFPRTPTWLVMTGNLMGEPSFSVIVSRLDEYFLHMGGGMKSPGVSIGSGDRVSALQAEVEQLKALLVQNRPQGPANPDLQCSNPNCKGKGHTIENCWKMGGGKQGQYPKWWKGRRDVPVPNPSANQTTVGTVGESDVSGPGNVYALTATTFQMISKPTSNPKDGVRTFADSGATAHFFSNKSVFRNYVERKGSVGNSSKKGVSFEILGQGDVDIQVTHQNQLHTLTFHNALHAPSITSNLISLSVLDGLGWTMDVGRGCIVFKEPGGKKHLLWETSGWALSR